MAQTAGSAAYPKWDLTWSYDRYGNRWNQTVQSDTSPNLQPPAPGSSLSADPATNRINVTNAGFAYDLNGNMSNNGLNMVVYDAENHTVSSSGPVRSGNSGGGMSTALAKIKQIKALCDKARSSGGGQIPFDGGVVPLIPPEV